MISVAIISDIKDIHDAVSRECLSRPALATLIKNGDIAISQESTDTISPTCEVVLADPGCVSKYLDNGFPGLVWLQCTFAGVNRIFEDTTRSDFIFTRIGRGFGVQMVEYVLGWILALQLQIPISLDQQRQCEWNGTPFTSRGILAGKNIGILGAGKIGTAIAEACKCVGLRPYGLCARECCGENIGPFDVLSDSVEEVLRASDIIVNCLPSTPHTRCLLSLDLLRSCCSSRMPVFINIGRGDVISTTSLLIALEENIISHAVLDVVEDEPLPSSSPLWTHPAVSITPHISAVSYPSLVAEVFADNFERYMQCVGMRQNSVDDKYDFMKCLNSTLLYLVDRAKGY